MKQSHLDRRTRYSKKMIRSALLDLMDEKELGAITVTDICNVADVNRGTFYKYYKDVRDLYEQLEDEFVDEIMELFLKSGPDAEDDRMDKVDIEMILGRVLNLIYNNRDFLRITQKGWFTSRMIQKILSCIKPHTVQLIRNSHEELTEEETLCVFDFIIGGTAKIVTRWIDDNMKLPVPKLQEMLVKMIYGSLTF